MKEEMGNEELIDSPYEPTKIRIDSRPMPVFQLMRKIQLNEINLQPDFQRNVVWDDIRQSRLIESLFIQIPLPSFYLDASRDDDWLVVDGLQRLWALDRFVNKKDLWLQRLEFFGEQLNGKNFDELPRNLQRRIEETSLELYIIRPDTPDNAKFAIFSRINTGGMVLTSQEIRHSLFGDPARSLLKKLAESDEFLEATNKEIDPKRMEDREYVLRYLAFHLFSYTKYNTPDCNKFLNAAMKKMNTMEHQQLVKLEGAFYKAMKISQEIFGLYAFRPLETVKYREYYRENPLPPVNKSLFEAWSVCLENFDIERLIQKKEEIIRVFIDTLNGDNRESIPDDADSQEYFESITQDTDSVVNVHARFRNTLAIIHEGLLA